MDFSTYEQLLFERPGPGILKITINRPDKYNATDETLHSELARVWLDVDRDPETRVALITGAGKAFSAGGDFGMIERMIGSYERVTEMLTEMADMVYNVLNCSKPIVAAINGAAVGAGLVVALTADISICSEEAQLGDGHVRLGVAAGDHAAIIWPLLAGMAKARYYLLTGEMLTGADAERIGMVSMAVPREEVVPKAMDVAARIAAGPQLALQFTKKSLNHWMKQAAPIFEQSAAYEMLTFLGPDVVEGVAALKERREPRFPSAL